MAVKIRQSKQRDAILAILRQSTAHPTAEDVYNQAREELPDISLGTVYRNLNFLADHNLIRRVKTKDNTVHFDGNMTPHYHFVCENCGQIYDIFPTTDATAKLISEVEMTGHKVHYSSINFVGLCAECANTLEVQEHELKEH